MSKKGLLFENSLKFFKPTSIAGLKLWLKADAGVYHDAGVTLATNGQTVQQWNDQSGNGKNATQPSAGQRPTFNNNGVGTFNGRPAINFNGVSTQLLCGANADFASTAFTVFVVYLETSPNPPLHTPNYGAVLNKGDGANASNTVWEIVTPFNNTFDLEFGTFSGSTDVSLKIGGSKDTELICGSRLDGTSKNLYRNGTLVASQADGNASLNAGATPLGIGSDGGAGTALPLKGSIQEILYYNTQLSGAQISQINAYLRARWGLPSSNNIQHLAASKGPYPGTTMYVYETFDSGSVVLSDANITNPVFTFPSDNGIGTSSDTQAISAIFYQGQYFVAYEFNVSGNMATLNKSFGIASATSLNGPWTHVADVVINPTPLTSAEVWQPIIFFDVDGSVHVIVDAQNNAAQDTVKQLYIVDALNTALTSWSAPTQITGTGFASCMTDHWILTPNQSINGLYNLFWKDEGASKLPGWSTSSSLKSGYTVNKTPASDWTGLGAVNAGGIENYYLHKVGNIWRFHYTKLPIGPFDESFYIDNQDGTWLNWSQQSATGTLYPVADAGVVQALLNG